MKFFNLLYLTLISINVLSQNNSKKEDSIGNIIKQDFEKIDFHNAHNLIPFRIRNKWGFIDRKTKKTVISAKYNKLEFFNPRMNGYFNGKDFFVTNTGEIKIINNTRNDVIEIEEVDSNEDFNKVRIVSSKDGYKGFTINENGALESYSDLYHYYESGYPTWNVNPFKFKNKTFAIVKNKNNKHSAIIDSVGNLMKGFEFKHKKILINRYSKDKKNIWFFIQNESDQWSLINTKGNYKMRNKIMTYPLVSGTKFGIGSLRGNGVSGIFDYYNMKWLIKPQNKIKIGSVGYSSSIELDIKNSEQRKKATIYYSVFEDKTLYYMDLKGNKYVPEN